MLPEQQQRILGYFIEEARDHLNTIEQGLLNLESTLNDPEMVNEVFRAAHSIKGGAAMLGLNSIQHTSHRLEDSFKVLKENPVKIDQKLESLFLGVSDTLKTLLEHLSGPFGLSEEAANTLMSETEPVFQWLNQHLELLVEQGRNGVASNTGTEAKLTPVDSVSTLTEIFFRGDAATLGEDRDKKTETLFPVVSHSVNDHWDEFQGQVLQILREMLQLFKQKATPESRQNLQRCCHQLLELGKTWNLPNWCNLCQAAANAIGNRENSYLTLAKIVITEIKQAQELVFKGREIEITISQKLEALLGFPEIELLEISQDLLGDVPSAVTQLTTPVVTQFTKTLNLATDHLTNDADVVEPTDSVTSLTELSEQLNPNFAFTENTGSLTPVSTHSFFAEDNTLLSRDIDSHGPEVGLAELNTLADLFEGETPELDETWQQEEILNIAANNDLGIETSDRQITDSDRDLADFLSFDDDRNIDQLQINTTTTADLNKLFDDNFLEKENSEPQNLQPPVTISDEILQATAESSGQLQHQPEIGQNDVIEDLLGIGVVTQPETEILPSIELSSSLDDLFQEKTTNADSLEEISLSNTIESNLISQPEELFLDNLFGDLPENTLQSTDESEINDLFDVSPTTVIEFSQTEDDLGNFWNQETQTEQQQTFESVLDQDIAQALEDSLFAAAASGEIFSDRQQDLTPTTESVDLEDLNINFQQPEQQLDLIFPSDNGDNLFEELTTTSSIVSLNIENSVSVTPETSISLPEILSFSQEPEALDFIPEFTNQQIETSLVNSPQLAAELEFDLFNANEENNDEILLENIDNLVDEELFATETELENVGIVDSSLETNSELINTTVVQPIELDFGDELFATEIELENVGIVDSSLETNSELINTTVVQPIELDFGDELFATEIELEDVDIVDSSLETNSELINTTVVQPIELDFGDELFATEIELEDVDIVDSSLETNSELINTTVVQPIELDFGDELFATEIELEDVDIVDSSLETNSELINTTVVQPIELDFGDELFATEIELEDVDIVDSSLETNSELINTTVVQPIELDFGDELFATETEILTTSDLADTTIEENAVTALETDENVEAINWDVLDETADLSEVLLETDLAENANVALSESEIQTAETTDLQDEFADLEALLGEEVTSNPNATSIPEEDFAALEALLGGNEEVTNDQKYLVPQPVHTQPSKPTTINTTVSSLDIRDEFGDLEKLLAEADQTISHSSPAKQSIGKTPRSSTRRTARFEETMKVPVKQLDDMSNLVGELVVNRNTLEQDHERLRQSLDNLLIQVQQLSDVGARMQELYERSLLEASLLASRKPKEVVITSYQPDSNLDRGFSELEMDRFTPFHTLSQEMIELIVRVRESASDIDFVTEESERVARQFRQVTTQLQEGLTRARMVPFAQTIDRLRRGVRDNAIKCGKQVELVIEGGDTLIDKMILDHLNDPLTHMLNNAIAHGIETPEERQACGKAPVGIITIRAFYQGNQTIISVGDDGAGIDSERVKAKAVKIGMIKPEQAKTISRIEIYDLLFQAGFSIKDQADEISGRGVGMDVVRSEISEIRGIVNTDSTLGKGTTFTIRLPLTLSICKALCCVSDKARIAFPMDGVEDTLDIPVKNIQHNADGQSFISWRDTVLPFRPLKELLTFNRQIIRGSVYGGTRDDDMVSVVVVRSGNTLIALQIDLVLSEQEIVIKQFEGPAPKPIGVAGATVLGDGRIMPIADVLEIIDIFQGRMSKHSGGTLWQQAGYPDIPEPQIVKIDPTVLIVDDSITVRELLSLTFNKAGYRVEQARDGQEAWDKLRSGLPCDIVFCDIEMPRCDGLELLSRIQKDSNLNHLPIAMLTSRGADKHRQMAIQLGASGYFTKPYLEEALLEAAARMLKGEKLVNSSNIA